MQIKGANRELNPHIYRADPLNLKIQYVQIIWLTTGSNVWQSLKCFYKSLLNLLTLSGSTISFSKVSKLSIFLCQKEYFKNTFISALHNHFGQFYIIIIVNFNILGFLSNFRVCNWLYFLKYCNAQVKMLFISAQHMLIIIIMHNVFKIIY